MTWSLTASGHTPADTSADPSATWETQERRLAAAIAKVLHELGGPGASASFHGNFVNADTLGAFPAADQDEGQRNP